MTAAVTPTLDRLTSAALQATVGLQGEIPVADIQDEAGDDVLALAWIAAEDAVPQLTEDNFESAFNTITEAFIELARIVMRSESPHDVRTIMAAAAITAERTHDGFDAFRRSVLFFIVNTPGGALDAAFELIMGLTDEDWEELAR